MTELYKKNVMHSIDGIGHWDNIDCDYYDTVMSTVTRDGELKINGLNGILKRYTLVLRDNGIEQLQS